MIVKLLTEHHLEFQNLKGGCTGSSESTLVKYHIGGNTCHGSFGIKVKMNKNAYDEAELNGASLCVPQSVTKSCECNSSYRFSQIFFKLCRYFCRGLKVCMTFGCNIRINFRYLFCCSNLIHF